MRFNNRIIQYTLLNLVAVVSTLNAGDHPVLAKETDEEILERFMSLDALTQGESFRPVFQQEAPITLEQRR